MTRKNFIAAPRLLPSCPIWTCTRLTGWRSRMTQYDVFARLNNEKVAAVFKGDVRAAVVEEMAMGKVVGRFAEFQLVTT
jgi:hypothetical protein